MAEPRFATEDDLPRTLRRAREEKERELRERGQDTGLDAGPGRVGPRAPDLSHQIEHPVDHAPPLALGSSGVVSRLEVPFFHLVGFFLKAVFAAIPAILLLAALLWLGGKALQTFFPGLGRMQIHIQFVGGDTPAASRPAGTPSPASAPPGAANPPGTGPATAPPARK